MINMNFRKLAIQSVVNAMVLDEGWNYDEAKKEYDEGWAIDEEGYFGGLSKKWLKYEIKLQKKHTTEAKAIGRKRDRNAVTWDKIWDEVVRKNKFNFIEYRTVKGGLMKEFSNKPNLTFKGSVKERIEYVDVFIDVIELKDEDLIDFDWEVNMDNFGLWTGQSDAVSLLDDATGGDTEDAYIMCSALIYAKGDYHIVTFDFFNDLRLTNNEL